MVWLAQQGPMKTCPRQRVSNQTVWQWTGECWAGSSRWWAEEQELLRKQSCRRGRSCSGTGVVFPEGGLASKVELLLNYSSWIVSVRELYLLSPFPSLHKWKPWSDGREAVLGFSERFTPWFLSWSIPRLCLLSQKSSGCERLFPVCQSDLGSSYQKMKVVAGSVLGQEGFWDVLKGTPASMDADGHSG